MSGGVVGLSSHTNNSQKYKYALWQCDSETGPLYLQESPGGP